MHKFSNKLSQIPFSSSFSFVKQFHCFPRPPLHHYFYYDFFNTSPLNKFPPPLFCNFFSSSSNINNLFSNPLYRRIKGTSQGKIGRPKDEIESTNEEEEQNNTATKYLENYDFNENDENNDFMNTDENNSINNNNRHFNNPHNNSNMNLSVESESLSPKLVSNEIVDISDVTIVNSVETALSALEILMSPICCSPNRVHAIDTETTNIDLSIHSPIGHGEIVCFSIYCGPDVNFGNGPRLWIDCLDVKKDPKNNNKISMFTLFKPYLENDKIPKVFHNYSFDCHMFSNHGITIKGFHADTMVMARLWDSARGLYSLESLSKEFLGKTKTPLEKRFSKYKIKKDGTIGKAKEMPEIHEIQRDPIQRDAWIDYSTYDTEATWGVYKQLVQKLLNLPWVKNKTMLEFYNDYYRSFGEMLVLMERRGITINKNYLKIIEKKAEEDQTNYMNNFIKWAQSLHDDNKYINVSSTVQKQHFFFGNGIKQFERDNLNKQISQEDWDLYHEEMKIYEKDKKNYEMKLQEWENNNKVNKPKEPLIPKQPKPKKTLTFSILGLNLKPTKKTKTAKVAAVSLPVLKELCGEPFNDPPTYGPAYKNLGGGEMGKRACEAIANLCEISAVNIMLQTFIKPLQESADENGRVHCSLGLNTETGRLSSRKPNLQNQPAIEKDRYKIRDAFIPQNGYNFIVADYGQLELRVLAHITACKSMIHAFQMGGDFHSRTAINMYEHIQKAIDNGEVLLEWDSKKNGKPAPLPLVKDKYSIERKYAKILNFSVAYGKTAAGLAKDFGKTKEEAEKIVKKWYESRPEVLQWQKETIEEARKLGFVRTLMGRYRPLYDINKGKEGKNEDYNNNFELERRYKYDRLHMERAAINTPIQGSAADIVMKAMLNIENHLRFKQIGWKILLQIHDELICEGPQEYTEEAMKIIKHEMSNPFIKPLLVDLVVDAKIGKSWLQAK